MSRDDDRREPRHHRPAPARKAFLESLKHADAQGRPELIGQFGVGFYSAFMVADKVTVVSRMAGDARATASAGSRTARASSPSSRRQGDARHRRHPAPAARTPRSSSSRGGCAQLVKKYSDFVEHPDRHGRREGGRGQEEDGRGDAQRAQGDLAAQQVRDHAGGVRRVLQAHLRTTSTSRPRRSTTRPRGTIEFKALLYVPAHKPFDLMWGDSNKGLQLYIQRVFIMDDCETLLPHVPALRHAAWSIRPTCRSTSRARCCSRARRSRRSSRTSSSKVLNTLDEMKTQRVRQVRRVLQRAGRVPQGGRQPGLDEPREARRPAAVRIDEDRAGKFTTLAEYVERMPGEQKEIYLPDRRDRELMEQSPLPGGFKAKG